MVDLVENATVDGDDIRNSPGTKLSSPQRLTADRVLAARASAAALAASAVRVGYVAAAVARAGGHSGHSRHPPTVQLGSGQSSSSRDGLPSHGVATAAVRAAAAHASVSSDETGSSFNTMSPRKLQFSTQSHVTESHVAPEREASCPTPDSLASTFSTESLSEATSRLSLCADDDVEREQEVQQSLVEDGPGADSSSAVPCLVEPKFEDREEFKVSPTCTENAESPVDMVAHENSILDAAAEDTVSEGEWDIVVRRTFITVVRRRRVLPHTASAPGCIGIGGPGLGAGGRQRRARSRRRSRRGSNSKVGTRQAATSNIAELHERCTVEANEF